MATRKKSSKKVNSKRLAKAAKEERAPGGLSRNTIMRLWEQAANRGDARLVVSCRQALAGSKVHVELVKKALERQARY